MQKRWDTDEIGHGVSSAATFTPPVHQLLDAMLAPDWITEDPEAHLLPHIQAAVNAGDSLRLDSSTVIEHCLEVRLTWLGGAGNWHDLEVDVYGVIASFAEHSTFIRKTVSADAISFEVTTGMMATDGVFATHGHTVRVKVSGHQI